MKQFSNLCSLISQRMYWVAGLFFLIGQTAGAYAPDDGPHGRGAPKVLGLGNRVFLDYNRDGIQNDSDPGVANLTLRLYRGGVLRGTTSSSSTGAYAFTNANVSEGLLPDTDYEIRATIADISSLSLTLTKADQGGDDNLDSDAQVAGNVAVIYARTSTSAVDAPVDSYDIGLVAEAPDLNIVKSATASPLVLGSNASFTIQVTNNSAGAATNVVVRDTLGAGMTYVSATGNPTVTTTPSSQTVLTWSLGTLLGGASANLGLTVKTTAEGVLYNTAYVTTTDAEPNTRNNVSRACVTVPIKLCPGDEYVASLPAGYTNVQWYRNGTLVSSGSSLTITQAGSYSFTSTTNVDCPANGCCPIIVEDGILPNLAITPVSPAICAGASTVLSLTGCSTGTIRWSTGESTASITVSPTSTATGVYSVTCASTTYGTCTAFASTTVTVNTNPVVALTSATICAGETASLTATAGFAQYVYSAGLTPVQGQPNVATGTTAGTYSVTAISAQGCSGTATGTITVNPLPVASIAVSSLTVCEGTSVTLTASNTSTPTGNTYRWSTNATTAQIIVTTSGVYSVTVTNAAGCTDVASTTIVVNPLPVAAIAASSLTICEGASTTLTASNTNTNVGGALSYRWSTGATTASITVSPASTAAGVYSVTVTSADGCSDTESTGITVNTNPVVALTSATICAGATASLTATAGFAQYVYSAGLTPLQGQPNIATGTVAGTYSVTAISTQGCSGTATGTIVVNPNPVVVLTSATICAGETASLTATAGFAQYVYSAGLTPVQGQPNVATGTTAGTYSVTAISAQGCSGTATGTITVNPLPVASIAASSLTVCEGTSVTLTASNTSTPTGNTYRWSANANSATTAQIIVTTSGVYSVTVTNAAGCTDVASTTIVVNPKPVLTVSSPTLTVFAGESTTLTVGGCGGTLVWSTGDNSASLIVAPLVTTTYSATCTLTTGCSSTTSATVTVRKAPSYTMAPMAVPATCNGATANSDAKIILTTLQDTDRVGIVPGSTYAGGPAYGAATAVTGGNVTFGGLPNPASKQPYTLRLFSANGDYFVDVTVMLSPAECICPAPKCVPIVIQKVR